ncbi:hypothetical protein ACFQ4O_07935 [Methylopila musalis]|uniref:Uncharacterized protein n=1 Tax=Methylopila musalis TaxID=1134781 RepID=A0ABW3Z6P2_9HYPH
MTIDLTLDLDGPAPRIVSPQKGLAHTAFFAADRMRQDLNESFGEGDRFSRALSAIQHIDVAEKA